MQSRVGIATGLVAAGTAGVVGEQTVVGDAPNLAARLQSFAEPGCVLVGPSTHRLTEAFFEYLFVGEHEIKGYREPIPMWKVLGEAAIESRFISARTAGADPILGRERETAFLVDAWQRATRGNGHVVVLSGEAGIGKSRLLEALVEHLRGTRRTGGARVQEGILALMQVPKTVAAVEDLHDSRTPFISWALAHPTTGGLLASFASLGDVLIAEPGALMSFAGPRVVQQTTREKLPDDFGLAESNYRFGHLDAVVPRPELSRRSPSC